MKVRRFSHVVLVIAGVLLAGQVALGAYSWTEDFEGAAIQNATWGAGWNDGDNGWRVFYEDGNNFAHAGAGVTAISGSASGELYGNGTYGHVLAARRLDQDATPVTLQSGNLTFNLGEGSWGTPYIHRLEILDSSSNAAVRLRISQPTYYLNIWLESGDGGTVICDDDDALSFHRTVNYATISIDFDVNANGGAGTYTVSAVSTNGNSVGAVTLPMLTPVSSVSRFEWHNYSHSTTGSVDFVIDDISITGVVPEPVTMALLAIGGCMALLRRRR